MTGGESAFLALVIGAMAIFAAALAYVSWEYDQHRRK